MEYLHLYGELIIFIAGVISALGVIYKLLRGWLKKFEKRFATSEIESTLTKKMTELQEKVLNTLVSKEQSMLQKIDDLDKRLTALSIKNDENERDRLKDVLFRYGNFCRKGSVITSEEFRKICQDFSKYTSLGGNDIAHDEYEFIKDYYNNKRWEKK